jgi:hypothetical protein
MALAMLLAPVHVAAVDSDLKHLFVFEVDASNGYSIFGLASNERADGRGEVLLFVSGAHAGVLYTAPAQLTATSLDADLGALGRISFQAVPSGREKTFQTQCEEGSRVSYEPQRYRGNFEFHGEEGYTEAVTDSPRERFPRLYRGECRTYSSLQLGGDVPGAGLRLHGRGELKLDLTARKNSPKKRTQLQVSVREERAGISISRQISQSAGAGAFDYDPLLRAAVLAPPAPFSGSASFHRNAAPANRWGGDLTVDLPGRSNVPLAGPRVKATLVAGCWAEGSRGLRC